MPIMNVDELARFFRVSPHSIYRRVADGTIRPLPISQGRHLFDSEAVRKQLEQPEQYREPTGYTNERNSPERFAKIIKYASDTGTDFDTAKAVVESQDRQDGKIARNDQALQRQLAELDDRGRAALMREITKTATDNGLTWDEACRLLQVNWAKEKKEGPKRNARELKRLHKQYVKNADELAQLKKKSKKARKKPK